MPNRIGDIISKRHDIRIIHRYPDRTHWQYRDLSTHKPVRIKDFVRMMMNREVFRVLDKRTQMDVTKEAAHKAFCEIMEGRLGLLEMYQVMSPHFPIYEQKQERKKEKAQQNQIQQEIKQPEIVDLTDLIDLEDEYGT